MCVCLFVRGCTHGCVCLPLLIGVLLDILSPAAITQDSESTAGPWQSELFQGGVQVEEETNDDRKGLCVEQKRWAPQCWVH